MTESHTDSEQESESAGVTDVRVRRRWLRHALLGILGAGAVLVVVLTSRPPVPIPVGGVLFSPGRALDLSAVGRDVVASRLRDKIDADLSTIELSEPQRAAATAQASELLVAHVFGGYDHFLGLVFSWGGAPGDLMTDTDLEAQRENWSQRVWDRVDVQNIRVWRAANDERGRLSLLTPTNLRPPGQEGVLVQSGFRYPRHLATLVRDGAPVLGISLPASVTSEYGVNQIMEVRFLFVWDEEASRWLPYATGSIAATTPPGVII